MTPSEARANKLLEYMNRKSYLGDSIVEALEAQMDKMVTIEAQQSFENKEKIIKLEDKLSE